MLQYASLVENRRKDFAKIPRAKEENRGFIFRPELRLLKANLREGFRQLMLQKTGR
jgi:hypothetical protein